MFKNTFLFITTLLVATSVSTGYGSTDSLKGSVNVETFLDWFNASEKYLHVRGLIILDLIPALVLIIQAFIFFKDRKKIKGVFAVLALLANFIGVFIAIRYAQPIASQMSTWSPESLPSNWVQLKDDWINKIGLHGVMGILGWLLFIITFFVSANNTGVKRLPRFLNVSKNALLFFLTFILGMGAASLYDFCFMHIQYEISGATFIELHRPMDQMMRKVGPIMFTIIVTLHVLLMTLFFVEKSKPKGWLNVVALFFLLCDTFIALHFNRPINDLFLTWTPSTVPVGWERIRDEWLNYHVYRNIFKVLGIISILLTYFVGKFRSAT